MSIKLKRVELMDYFTDLKDNFKIGINEYNYFKNRLSNVKKLKEIMGDKNELNKFKENVNKYVDINKYLYEVNENLEPIELNIPRIEEKEINVINKDYKKYIDSSIDELDNQKIEFWKSHYNNTDFNTFDIEKYGKDKIYTRELYYKKSYCNMCLCVINDFIKSNNYINSKYDELMEHDFLSDIFNRKDLNFQFIQNRKIIKADENTLLMIKYIFSVRYTFKDTLYKMFSFLSKGQVDYIIKRLLDNKLIEVEYKKETKTTIIIPSHILDNIILKTKVRAKNKISHFDFVKNKSKNDYIVSKIQESKVNCADDIEKVLKSLPPTLFYKGAERLLYSLKNTESRYLLEYKYLKLLDIKNSLQCFIRVNKQKSDLEIQNNLDKIYIPLYETLNYILDKTYYSTASFGKSKDYYPLSLRSFAENGIHIYNIKINKDNRQSFDILTLQTLEDFRTSKFVYKQRDIIIYMCSNTFEEKQKVESNKIQFYDNYTREIFLNKLKSIKTRIKDEKTYYFYDCRTELSKCLSNTIYFCESNN